MRKTEHFPQSWWQNLSYTLRCQSKWCPKEQTDSAAVFLKNGEKVTKTVRINFMRILLLNKTCKWLKSIYYKSFLNLRNNTETCNRLTSSSSSVVDLEIIGKFSSTNGRGNPTDHILNCDRKVYHIWPD